MDFDSGIFARNSPWSALAEGSKSRAPTLIDTADALTTGSHGQGERDRSRSRRAVWKKLGWKAGLAAALIAAGYSGWLLIPLVVKSDFAPHFKTTLIAVLGATPLLTKFAAVALFGSEAINFLKRHIGKLWQRDGS